MKFAAFFLSAFCVFHAKSDSISEFKAVADKATQNIADYDEEFHRWIVVTLSNLKDGSTDTLAESWIATFNLTDIVREKAKTKEQKDCIISEKNKLIEVIKKTAFTLDTCVRNSSEIGEPTRKSIQGAHMACMKIQNELEEVKNNCGTTDDKLEECISLKVNELKSSLKGIQEQVNIYNIEARTIKPRILSDVMHCIAKLLTEIHESVTTIQDMIKKCV